MLLAFMNPSGPTRELKQFAAFLSDIVFHPVLRSVKQRASCVLMGSR